MTRVLPAPAPWAFGAIAAVAVGSAAAWAGAWALVGAAALVGTVALVAARERSAWVVAGYWALFCTYETVLRDVLYVPGLFYPFYGAFIATVLVLLIRGRLALPTALLWNVFAFLIVVLLSFVGFAEPIGFDVLQRLVAYLVGPLVALQFTGRHGLRAVQGTAIATGAALAVWVVVESITSGFADRAGVTADPNVVSFFIGLGLVAALADAVAPTEGVRRGWAVAATWIAVAAMTYAVLLLASRGIAIALAIAIVAVVGRAAARKPERLLALAIGAAAVFGTTLLPGGEVLIERFTDESVASGNNRIPVWIGALRYYAQGDAWDLLFGHGFGSSWSAVQRVFGHLTSTHNAFLQLLVEFGIVGLGLFLALHAQLTIRSFQVEERLGTTMFGLLAFLLAANLSLNAADGFLYWTALGLVIGMATWAPARAAPASEMP